MKAPGACNLLRPTPPMSHKRPSRGQTRLVIFDPRKAFVEVSGACMIAAVRLRRGVHPHFQIQEGHL